MSPLSAGSQGLRKVDQEPLVKPLGEHTTISLPLPSADEHKAMVSAPQEISSPPIVSSPSASSAAIHASLSNGHGLQALGNQRPPSLDKSGPLAQSSTSNGRYTHLFDSDSD